MYLKVVIVLSIAISLLSVGIIIGNAESDTYYSQQYYVCEVEMVSI